MMIMTAYDATKRYIDKLGGAYQTNSTDYFEKSAGQYATMDRFAFTQKLFGTHERYSDGYVFSTFYSTYDYTEFTNDFTAVLGLFGNSVTIETLLTTTNQTVVDFRDKFDIDPLDFQFGLSQRREMIKKFVDGNVNQSDYVDLVYVYGSSSFSLDRDTIIKVDSGGFSLQENLSANSYGGIIHPYPYPVDKTGAHLPANTFLPENFNFESSNAGAQVFNAAWADTIAPDGGDAFDLTFTPEYQTNNTITQYTKLDHMDASFETNVHKSENKEAIKKYWNDNFEAIRNKINEEGAEEFDNYDFYSVRGASLALKSLPYIIPSLANDIIAAYVAEEELEKDLMLELDFGNVIGAFSLKDAFHCFPAGTMITLHDGSQKAIENISMGDAVLSFDAEGNKVAGRVTQLLDNVTDTWLKLSRSDDADWSTVVTPGHRYLTPDGSYEEIKDIITTHSRIVDVDGQVVEVTAEAIHYSAANAHMFEQHAMMKTWSSGGLAMQPQYVEGWRTYNFTVETHHNYVAEDIRVHNDSVLSTLEDGDTLVSLDETYNHMAVLRDVDGDGVDEVVINEGTHSDEGNYILITEHVYEAPSSVTDTEEWLRIGDPNKTYDGVEDANGKTYTGDDGETKTIDLYSNPLDPGFGNGPGDGVTSDDLREIMTDDLGFTETITPGRFMHFGLLVERITYVLKDVLGNEVEYGDSGGFGGIGGGLVSPFGAAVETFFTLVLEDGSVVETSLLLDDDLTDFGDITSFILANGTTTAWSDLEITPEGGIATNTPPVAADDDDFTTSVDTVLEIPVDNLLANDSDADGDTLSIISVQDGVNGTPTLNADGSISFMPDIEFSGDASFTYTVSDDNGGEATATVNIIVDVGTAKIVITGTDGDDYISTSYTDADGETPSNEGETIEGLGGNDRIYAFAGDDTMLGGDGNDYMRGYAGADVNDGGAGFDVASYYGSKEGVIVNLETGVASGGYAEGDTFISIEGLVGSRDHDDELYGDAGNNKLYGRGGDDKLVGGAGNDYMRGYEGADIYDGGVGVDTASYYGATEGVVVNLETGFTSGSYAAGDTFISIEGLMGSENHNDELTGDAGDNRLYGRGGDDKLVGGDGDDYLRGYDGNDIIDGGAGADMASYWGSTSGVTINLATGAASGGYAEGDTFISIENILSSKHADVLSGDAGNNRLSSSDGDDELYGFDGDDHLLGGSGSDILDGGAGNDLLDGGGGTGIDYLTGGADADTFHFDRGEGEDHVVDFQDDIDTIEFDGFTEATTAANFINDFATQSGDNVIFDLGVDGMLVVENTTIVQIENDVELFPYIS